MSIHSGHRQRVKTRFRAEGLDNFSDVQVLELLLFYAIPRQDTNPIAHALLDHFGSLPQVMNATPEELEKVPGVGENAALLLKLTMETARYCGVSEAMQLKILTDLDQCGRYLVPFFHARRNETVFLLCLDAKCKVLCCKEIGEGSINSAAIPIRRIVETALGANATSVVLAHNHPSGVALPSGEDIATTRRVARALSTVEITLVDHIVVADNDYVSLVQSGYSFADCTVY